MSSHDKRTRSYKYEYSMLILTALHMPTKHGHLQSAHELHARQACPSVIPSIKANRSGE